MTRVILVYRTREGGSVVRSRPNLGKTSLPYKFVLDFR